MTPEQLREAAAVMIAAAEGKPLQMRARAKIAGWTDVDGATWCWSTHEYRIKPEPSKVRVALYRSELARNHVEVFQEKEIPEIIDWKRVSDIVEIEVKE